MTMQTTITPTAERSITIIRKHARRPHPASRHPAPPSHARAEQPITEQTPRARVLDGFRNMARGVDVSTAEEQTKAFYRSSGQQWAHSLTEQGGNELKARVVDAFRKMAHGVQDASAHARSLQFYGSGGQAWAQNLG
ncbi:MAG: hypothetical protein LJE97_10550 [Betaproteobacteria bacterium]|jgi:hypothetical protein|nr:hypothetical protein [Betaproteobacteria bacterium]